MTTTSAERVSACRRRRRSGKAVLRLGNARGAEVDVGEIAETLISNGLLKEWDAFDEQQISLAVAKALRLLALVGRQS